MLSWKQLARLEPRLKDLERQALAAHENGSVDWSGWEATKAKLNRLVGWWSQSSDSRLTSNAAWKTAYSHLLFCLKKGHRPSEKPKRPEGGLPSLEELERLSQPDLGITPWSTTEGCP